MTELKGYHAHVYYDQTTRPVAERLRDTIIGQFAVKPGAFSDEPIGPHPMGLDVLVHPLTESSYNDHSKNALWLGTPVPMRLEILRPTYRTELLPAASH